MARRSPPHGLKSWLRVESLEERSVPAAYQVTPLPADFPGQAAGLTPDGFYNSPEGIRRLNAGVVVPKEDFSGGSPQLVASFGNTVYFSTSDSIHSNVLNYYTTGQPGYSYVDGSGLLILEDDGPFGGGTLESAVRNLVFAPGSGGAGGTASGGPPTAYYTLRVRQSTGSGSSATSDLYRSLDGARGVKIAGHGGSAYERARNVQIESIEHLTMHQGTLYFVGVEYENANTEVSHAGLYSVGPNADVALVGYYQPGQFVRSLHSTSVGLLSVVGTAAAGDELFAGLDPLLDINPGPAGSQPTGFHDAGGRVYFGAADGTHGAEPWVTDGSAGGTRLLKDVNPGPGGSDPGVFAGSGGHVYFGANSVDAGGTPTGVELWFTDGTEAGTRLTKDISPGPGNGVIPTLFADGRGVLFAAATGQFVGTRLQYNLWQSDGTAAGTRLVHDFAPEGLYYNPGGTFRFGNSIHFQAVAPVPGSFFGNPVPWQAVRLPNRAPVTTLPPDDRVARPGEAFGFTLPADTFTDPDSDTLTLIVTRDGGTALPAWLTYDPLTHTFSGTPSATDLGEVRVKVVAADPEDATAAADFQILVDTAPNHAPRATGPIPDASTRIGFQVVAHVPAGTFTDADLPDGDFLTYTPSRSDGGAVPEWLRLFGTSFVGTPPLGSLDATTTYPLRVTATDRAGLTASADFTLTVEVIQRPKPATVYVDRAFFTQAPVDPDGTGGPATEFLYDGFNDLQQALDAVAPGGTVVVRGGSYSGPRGGQAGPEGPPRPITTAGKAVTIALGSGRDGADAAEVELRSPLTLDANTTLQLSVGAGGVSDRFVGAPVALNGATLAPVGAAQAGDAFALLAAATGAFGAIDPSGLAAASVVPGVDYSGGGAVLAFTPPPAVALDPVALPAGRVGSAYEQVLTATGGAGAFAFAVSAGAVPAGLTLSAGGVLSGTPTVAGAFAFTVTATSAGGAGSRDYVLVVASAPVDITVSPPALPGGRVGDDYDQTITATGGAGVTGPFTFAVLDGELPPGLAIAADGRVAGAPTRPGTFGFTVKATAAAGGFVIVPRAIEVAPAGAPVPPPGDPGSPGTVRLTVGRRAGGGPADLVVRNPDGSVRFNLSAFGGTFGGDVRPTTGDLNGDGVDEVILTPGAGGAPRVEVYDGATGELVQNFFAFNPAFRGGATAGVAGGVLVVGAGPGGGPHVKYFADGTEVASFFAFAESFRGGVTLAVGDVDGDGEDDVVVGAGTGGGPSVVVFDGATGGFRAAYFVGPEDDRGGVAVAVRDLDGDGRNEVVARAAGTTGVFEPLTGRDLTDEPRFDGIDLGDVLA